MQVSVYRNKFIFHEISKEHDKLCRALEDEEEIRNEAKLFALISHEIKTPLNVVLGFSKEIEEYHPAVPSEAKYFATHISEAASYILDILSDLLEHFRLKSGEYWTIRTSPMDLHKFWALTCQKVWMSAHNAMPEICLTESILVVFLMSPPPSFSL